MHETERLKMKLFAKIVKDFQLLSYMFEWVVNTPLYAAI